MTMLSGEQPLPQRARAASEQPPCQALGSELERYLAGEQVLAKHPLLRAHLACCADCNEKYRSALLAAARVGRERRRERESHPAPVPAGRTRPDSRARASLAGFLGRVLFARVRTSRS